MNSSSADVISASISGAGWMGKDTGGRQTATHGEIARLAFYYYEINGRRHGHDVDDWLLAERELAHHFA